MFMVEVGPEVVAFFLCVCVYTVSTIATHSKFLGWQNSTKQSVEFGRARV